MRYNFTILSVLLLQSLGFLAAISCTSVDAFAVPMHPPQTSTFEALSELDSARNQIDSERVGLLDREADKFTARESGSGIHANPEVVDGVANQPSDTFVASDFLNESGVLELPQSIHFPLVLGIGFFALIVIASLATRAYSVKREQAAITGKENDYEPSKQLNRPDSKLISQHDVRNLLTAIVSAAELGKMIDDPERKDELFEQIVKSGISAATAISNREAESDSTSPNYTDSKKRILFVDDDKFVLDTGQQILSSQNVELTKMESAEAAIATLESGQLFDCVVTDFNLTDLNGDEVAKCVREVCPETPVVLISGNSKADVFNPELYDAFVAKPFRASDLSASVAKVIMQPSGVSQTPSL